MRNDHLFRFSLAGLWVLLFPLSSHALKNDVSQQEIDMGAKVYQQYCAACHGSKGEGQPAWDKRNALGELPAPPHGPEGHTWKHGDGMLYRIIRDGWRDPFNKTKRVTMPSFKDVLTPQEIRSVTNYLKTLWTPEQQAVQREESQQKPFPPEAMAAEGQENVSFKSPSEGKK